MEPPIVLEKAGLSFIVVAHARVKLLDDGQAFAKGQKRLFPHAELSLNDAHPVCRGLSHALIASPNGIVDLQMPALERLLRIAEQREHPAEIAERQAEIWQTDLLAYVSRPDVAMQSGLVVGQIELDFAGDADVISQGASISDLFPNRFCPLVIGESLGVFTIASMHKSDTGERPCGPDTGWFLHHAQEGPSLQRLAPAPGACHQVLADCATTTLDADGTPVAAPTSDPRHGTTYGMSGCLVRPPRHSVSRNE
ncbi:MAG: hypothetical protein HYX75_16510 [Acidobacteria bacterium]|nr:hypothetical protein [Acidobacteriota bacterium]